MVNYLEVKQYLNRHLQVSDVQIDEFSQLFYEMHPQDFTEHRVSWLISYIPRFALIFKYEIFFRQLEEEIIKHFELTTKRNQTAKFMLARYLAELQREAGQEDHLATLERMYIVSEVKQNLVDPYTNRYMTIFQLTGVAQYFILVRETPKLLALMRLATTPQQHHWQFFNTDGYIVGMYYGPRLNHWDVPHHFSHPDWILILDPNMEQVDELALQAKTTVINGPNILSISPELEHGGDIFIVSETFEYMNGNYLVDTR